MGKYSAANIKADNPQIIMIAHAVFFYFFFNYCNYLSNYGYCSKKYSTFCFFIRFIVSCLFIMIGAEFLGMIMLIVYVGAVAVLFLFVVMMLNVAQQKNQWFGSSKDSKHIPIGLLFSLIIFFELIIVVGGWKYKPDLLNSSTINIAKNTTNTHSLGSVLYTDYIHLFQLSGMILLVAMIGAIVLTYRERAGVKRQSYIKQISREKKDGVQVVDAKIIKE